MSSFVEIGKQIVSLGYGLRSATGIDGIITGKDGKIDDARQSMFLLAAILDELQNMHRTLDSIPRRIALEETAAQTKLAKVREKAAKAELEAKQAVPTVVVGNLTNEVIDMIPMRRLRGKW